MRRRHPGLARIGVVAGLLALTAVADRARSEPPEPPPGDEDRAQTVSILDARDEGAIALVVRGQGDERVRVEMLNTTGRRLHVVFPAGLVAAAVTGQVQNMGLGSVSNRPGAFGRFEAANLAPESSTADRAPRDRGVTVPPGRTVGVVLSSVCLNYGVPTPTPDHLFHLVDVDEYTQDRRARKALRSLATLGTSQGVAQAVMWHVFNGMSFPRLARQAAKALNAHELAIASRFVSRLDRDDSDLVGPDTLADHRISVQVRGEGGPDSSVDRLQGELDGLRILGLPARSVAAPDASAAPALHLAIDLPTGPTRGRVAVRYAASSAGRWSTLGTAPIELDRSPADLGGPDLAEAVDRAVAATFVSSRPVHRSVGVTTLKIDNRLPFTLAHVVIRAGSASVPFPALGVGPLRSMTAPIQAAKGTVERVELNGL